MESVIDVSIPYFYYVSTGIGKLLVGDQMHFPMKENVYIKNVLDYLECFPKIPLLFLEITPVWDVVVDRHSTEWI